MCELELALKAGPVNALFDVALRLVADVPMRIGTASKAECGYRLAAMEQVLPVKAGTIRLSRGMSREAGFRAIALACLAHMRANEAGVVEKHPESLHQMRVGLRRLRSMFKMAERLIAIPPELDEEWRWLANGLGPARDWDVLADSTLAKVEARASALSDTPDLGPLRDAADGAANAEREHVAQLVQSSRYARLILAFSSWLWEAAWREGMPASRQARLERKLGRFADRILEQDRQRLAKRARRLEEADPGRRHRVRIAAKRSRYATEFFESLYPPRRVGKYIGALSRLQDELGVMNDAEVGRRLLDELERRDGDLAPGVEYAKGYLHAGLAAESPRLKRRWKRFSSVDVPAGRVR